MQHLAARFAPIPITALFFAIGLPLQAPNSSAGKDQVMAGTTTRTLKNGLKLIVREQHGASLVAIDLWVRAGSSREEPKEVGAAHFLEHLLFKGTSTRGRGEIDSAFEDLGASLNAGTTRDGAHFYSTVATQFLDRALETLSDAVRNSTLAPEEMERERTVILDELARDKNDWRKQTIDAVRAAIYPGQAYGRPVLGTAESIAKISREDVAGFYRRYYLPNNATIAVVGDVSPVAAEAAVDRAFGSWNSRIVEVVVEHSYIVDGNRRVELPSPTNRIVAALGFPGPPGSDQSAACASDVITALLADPQTGRLTAALKKVVLPGDVGTDYLTLKGPSVIAVFAATNKGTAADLERSLEAEIRRLITEPIPPGELDYAKRRLLGGYLFDIETYAGQARMLGNYDCVSSIDFAMRYVSLIKQVSPHDIQVFARKYLDAARAVRITFMLKGSTE